MFYTPLPFFPPLLYNVLRKPEAITKKKISSGGKSDAVLIDKR